MLKLLRSLHLYIGIFIAPALLFFAFTGALQTFSLHETTQGNAYKPPAWIVTLAQIHKKQTDVVPVRKPRPDAASAPAVGAGKQDKADGHPPVPATAPAEPKTHMPMKIFFLLVSIGLFTSTLTGIYMAYKYNRSKVVVSGLLVSGVVVPLVLLLF